MTPTLPEIMASFAVVLSTPLPPEATGDYTAGRTGMLSMLAALSAQEAQRGPAVRIWENGAIRELLGEAAGAYDAAFDGALSRAAAETDTDLTWSGLDAANAGLRRLLIALHEQVEASRDNDLDHRIIAFYGEMAHARRLELGG